MGLISNSVLIKWERKTCTHYKSLGYIFTKIKDEFEVNVDDLPVKSHVLVKVECDNCNTKFDRSWSNYKKYIKENNKCYCGKCASSLYGVENARKASLTASMSFQSWCLNNNRQDILNRWDYELNSYKPNEISYGSKIKNYFKCPRNLHKSEQKVVHSFTNGQEGSMYCNQCNSFAQWGIDNLGEDFLEKYWDYDKNIIDPWETSYGSSQKVWIKCQEKDYHGSYFIMPHSFTTGNRCLYCAGKKVNRLDSLGITYVDVFDIWSLKNENSPYEYLPRSHKKVWWKCKEEIHEDYLRSVDSSTNHRFKCPKCQYSKGEIQIEIFLNLKNIKYTSQKIFNELFGINGGNLSYDFYLSDYNLLIEYQGEMHEKFIRGIHKSNEDFEKQQEHDKRKKEYAKYNNIQLLEIWYWDFDKIEEILEKQLNKIKI